MKTIRKCLLSIVALLAAVAPLAAQQKDLTYHTVPPCYVVNTFSAGGAFAPNETRTYNVVGNGSFASQGGSATGCGVPGFSNGIARVQAVALNVLVVNPTGAGHIWAIAADTAINPSTTPTFMNFPAAAGQCCISLSNTGPVAVAQASGVGDIKINVAVSGANVIVSVVGYYSRFGETILVGPGATPAASGTALLNALTSIADNSASKPYLIKLEPGTYDVGTTMVVMKPYVDIEGSGQEATVIKGNGNGISNMTATVKGADFAELRDLQVKSAGTSTDNFAVAIALNNADTTIRNVTARASGAIANWGIRMVDSAPVIEAANIEILGAGYNYGIVTDVGSAAIVRRSVIRVEGIGTSGTKSGIYMEDGGYPKELTDVEILVKGGTTGTGVDIGFGAGSPTITIRNSKIAVSDSSTATYGIKNSAVGFEIFASRIEASGSNSIGIDANLGAVRVMSSSVAGTVYTVVSAYAEIGATFLNGGPAYGTCAGVYDESFTFYASTCP